MHIQTTLANYKSLGEYFSPDYEQENEVLNDFKKHSPNLSNEQVHQLTDILINDKDIVHKYFVADLLYLYDNFDQKLLDPLLQTAINHKDRSFNRIFLRPCITSFGLRKVADTLAGKFQNADIEERIGISNLLYWLREEENGELDNLNQVILARADSTKNLVELYHYKLSYLNKLKDNNKIPNNASELIEAINGNAEYEELLFSKLGWTKISVS